VGVQHGGPSSSAQIDATEGTEFVTVLAAGIALEGAGGVVLRTSNPGTPDHLHGWRLHQGRLDPLTAGEVFSAYCTDAATGDPLSPEPGVEYCAGFPVTNGEPPLTPKGASRSRRKAPFSGVPEHPCP
jgi:hypothetical protein